MIFKYGRVATWTRSTGVILGNRMQFFDLSVFWAVRSISFFFSFYRSNSYFYLFQTFKYLDMIFINNLI
jgi:hypothetical protein